MNDLHKDTGKTKRSFRFGRWFYRFHYGLGVNALRLFRRIGRFVGHHTRRPRRLVRYYWLRLVVRPVHRFFRRFVRMFGRVPDGVRELGEAARKNLLSTIPCFFRLIGRAFSHHREAWFSIGRLLGPVLAAAVLVTTVSAWVQTGFVLTLTYRGNELGVISNAVVYDEGASMARDRVTNEDDSFSVDAVPILTMTMQRGQVALSGTQVCDAILRTSGNSIAEATGLYVEGTFIGAMESREEMQAVLDGLMDGHYDKNDPDQRAEFVQRVEMADGLFPISTVLEQNVLHTKLTNQTVVARTYTVQAGDTLSTIAVKNDMTTAELRAMNPQFANTDRINIGDELLVQRAQTFLQVKVLKTIRYTETIDYNTKTVYRDDKPVTYSKVTTKGQEGSQDVVADITYIDGFETGRKVVSTTVTKQPVTKVVERGTKPVTSSSGSTVVQGDGVTTGSMLWPVPACHSMSRGYFRGHYALDIANGPVPVFGKAAVAADGGTIIQASTGWNGGYGNVVKIQHSNGLVTVYAHLSSIKVVKGQQVTRGQTIGLVGNSGRSTGPHLHFEVIKNGVKVNPLNYVKP
ncbi:MAG: peptidoglycan DD-metalloendopeptidase family protein [Clostridia bacterium]|nr:peptidoglycan DD-metalloendopeptidase family protein [Clostridia bacterium]